MAEMQQKHFQFDINNYYPAEYWSNDKILIY